MLPIRLACVDNFMRFACTFPIAPSLFSSVMLGEPRDGQIALSDLNGSSIQNPHCSSRVHLRQSLVSSICLSGHDRLRLGGWPGGMWNTHNI